MVLRRKSKFSPMNKIGVWNMRGLNDPLKQKEVCFFIKLHKLYLFGVVETKIRFESMSNCVSHCFPKNWLSCHNEGAQFVSRIIVGWDPHFVTASVVSSCSQEVTLEVEILACHLKFFIFMVYGYNLASDRDRLWQELRVLHSSFLQGSLGC